VLKIRQTYKSQLTFSGPIFGGLAPTITLCRGGFIDYCIASWKRVSALETVLHALLGGRLGKGSDLEIAPNWVGPIAGSNGEPGDQAHAGCSPLRPARGATDID